MDLYILYTPIMNRSIYYNYVENKLFTLSQRIESRWKLNILDLHILSENFYLNLLNKLFWWELKNLNIIKQNVESIDLIDEKNKYIIQVSATCTKDKIENTLSKKTIEWYKKDNYNFKFISISKNADKLRKKNFKNPFDINFNPESDILDINSLLKTLIDINDIKKQEEIYNFIKDELGWDLDIVKMESNIAMVINILSEENLSINNSKIEISPFEIKRKIDFNNLDNSQQKIDDYKIYHTRINNIYGECDKLWKNKSLSILNKINTIYLNLINKFTNNDDLYNRIIDELIDLVIKSSNYKEIPYEELLLCIDILVVDAFIRCKIFKNPNNYNYVTTW